MQCIKNPILMHFESPNLTLLSMKVKKRVHKRCLKIRNFSQNDQNECLFSAEFCIILSLKSTMNWNI